MAISKDAKLIGRFRQSGPIAIGPPGAPDLSLSPTLGADSDYQYSVFQDRQNDTTTVILAFPTDDITAFVTRAT
jgi:hypothetical protein